MVEFRLLLNDVWLNSALRSVLRPYADSTARIPSSSDGAARAGLTATRVRGAARTYARTYARRYIRTRAIPDTVQQAALSPARWKAGSSCRVRVQRDLFEGRPGVGAEAGEQS